MYRSKWVRQKTAEINANGRLPKSEKSFRTPGAEALLRTLLAAFKSAQECVLDKDEKLIPVLRALALNTLSSLDYFPQNDPSSQAAITLKELVDALNARMAGAGKAVEGRSVLETFQELKCAAEALQNAARVVVDKEKKREYRAEALEYYRQIVRLENVPPVMLGGHPYNQYAVIFLDAALYTGHRRRYGRRLRASGLDRGILRGYRSLSQA